MSIKLVINPEINQSTKTLKIKQYKFLNTKINQLNKNFIKYKPINMIVKY